MKCAACHRPIATPSLTLAGPVCARRVLFEAGHVLQPSAERQHAVVRDQLTRDLFQATEERTVSV